MAIAIEFCEYNVHNCYFLSYVVCDESLLLCMPKADVLPVTEVIFSQTWHRSIVVGLWTLQILLFPEGLLGWGWCTVDQHKCIFITMSDVTIPYFLFCVHLHIYGEEGKLLFSSNFWGFFLILVACSSREAFDEICNTDF